MRRRSSFRSIVVLALLATACASGPPEPPLEPIDKAARNRKFGDTLPPEAIKTVKPSKVPKTGILELRVRDQDGRGRSDIRVRYSGARTSGIAYTGRGGIKRLKLPPGRYIVSTVPGCQRGDKMEVLKGQTGEGGVVAGQTTPAELRVRARRRFGAGAPIVWRPEPPWPRNETITFRFTLYDLCHQSVEFERSFGELRYRASSHLRIVDQTPKRTDEDGYATVRFRCVRAGNPTLRLEDPENPRDGIDLLTLRRPFDPDADWCA